MSPRNERLARTLLILGILAILFYLGKSFWEVARNFSNLILLVALGSLLAYILSPVARWLDRGVVPRALTGWVQRRWGDGAAGRLRAVRVPYSGAAVLLYLLVLSSFVLSIVIIVPGIVVQLGQLAQQLSDIIDTSPDQWQSLLDEIAQRLNIDRQLLADLDPIGGLVENIAAALPDVLLNAVSALQTIAGGVASILLVLILSLYLMLDSQRLSQQLYRVVPVRYQDELAFLSRTLDRTFGGILRAIVIGATSQAIFTTVLMALFGLRYSVITGILSGFVAAIPELGAPLSMFAPAVAAVLQGSSAAVPVLIISFIFQQILLRFILPRVMSEALGMPTVLVVVSVLAGAQAFGFWGVFFSVPVAAAIYTIATVTLEQMKQTIDAQDQGQLADETVIAGN